MKRSTGRVLADPVSAESLVGAEGGKSGVGRAVRKHTTVAQSQAIARASRCRMELIREGVIPKEQEEFVKWPIVWVKPKTGASFESHIYTKKPRAMVFDPSRNDGGYITMTIKRALSKFVKVLHKSRMSMHAKFIPSCKPSLSLLPRQHQDSDNM